MRERTKRNAKNESIIMLSKVKTLEGYKLDSLDGEIGTVKEFYFDDRHWTIRYLVAETGTWLADRQVLISPYALSSVDKDAKNIAVDLTKKQIEDSPAVGSDNPVSRQREEELHAHYGWSPYWSMGPYAGVGYPVPGSLSEMGGAGKGVATKPAGDPTLRSMQQVRGYHIQGTDGEIGHVEDFIIDDVTWAIRYLVVDTKNWWPGKHVLIAPQWIERVSWEESKVFVNLEREMIKGAPAYTPAALNREYELKLYRHYGRFEYWADEPVAQAQLKAKNIKYHKHQNQQSS
ncbi:MAG: PRC-barrel domain-containing protein [Verrucomicrobiota bacterium]